MDVLQRSLQELADDFSEIAELSESGERILSQVIKKLKKKKNHIPLPTFGNVESQLFQLKKQYNDLTTEAKEIEKNAKKSHQEKEFKSLLIKKEELTSLLRSYQLQASSLTLTTDWQSPTFLHSISPLAGRQTGEIKATVNDYKRDFHNDATEYEKLFTQEYIDVPVKSALYTYAVASGMAALTTIIFFLLGEKKDDRVVFLGQSSYFENKELVSTAFGNQVIEVDESDTTKLCEMIKKQQPGIIFLDTLCNNATVTMPDTLKIISYLLKYTTKEITLVLDNTGLTFFLQPLTLSVLTNRRIRLIVFESLNKYHQFGLDRVTGGFMWAFGKETGKLFLAREHTGTNITDVASLALPHPNRTLLEKRMLRLSRNALLLSQSLQDWIDTHPASKFESIYHPSLPHHKAFSFAKKNMFNGSYFVITLKKKYQSVSTYQRFVQNVIAESKRRNVQIVSGTSFGFNTSRIYLTALCSDVTEPFIRFSVGTESLAVTDKITEILQSVMASL